MKRLLPLAVLTLCCLLAIGVAACSGTATTSTTAPTETSTTTSGQTETTAAQTGTTVAGASLWTELKPPGTLPAARAGQGMVYDSKNGKVIVFGGTNSQTFFNDTWAYSVAGNAWTELKPSGDLPTGWVAMSTAYDPATGKVVVFGGMTKTELLGDTWVYDPAANTWTKLQPAGGTSPSARGGSAMVYDASMGKVLLFGGKDDSGVLNDTWTLDVATSTWTKVAPVGDQPTARYGHAMAVDESTGKVTVFGGWDSDKYFNSTWVYDPAANTWASLDTRGTLPTARAGHCLTYDAANGKLVMFGGTSGKSFLRDVIYFDSATATWGIAPTADTWPAGRNGHSMVYDSAAKVLILFGGWDGKTYFNDTWSLAG